ncbi:LysM peptidoglycan-binding domain-containing protein [Candidatus Microgenomates bacterium]|nr:LysM peptidoglycan-binding domain-containing protein [Candidatus Microgenomates bacterium]
MDDLIKVWLKKLKLSESTISMALGALVVIVVGILIFNYFSKGEIGEEIKPEELEMAMEGSEGELEIGEITELPATYKVKNDDHLWAIAVKYYQNGYKWTEIAKANNLASPNLISPGQELTIPEIKVSEEKVQEIKPEPESINSEKYQVQKGDCLWSIALRAYGDPYKWSEIAKANELGNPDLIYPETELNLPR